MFTKNIGEDSIKPPLRGQDYKSCSVKMKEGKTALKLQIEEKVFEVLVIARVNYKAKEIYPQENDITRIKYIRYLIHFRKHEVKALIQRLYHSRRLRKIFREKRVKATKWAYF